MLQHDHKRIGPDKDFLRKIVIIFLPINLNMCCDCSKEPPDWDGSFGYPQHMFWLSYKKNNYHYVLFSWGTWIIYNTGGKPRNYQEIVLTYFCSQATSGTRSGSF